ncbi:MAG: hypothetical protein AB7P69_29130 [Candidatus Binatia bacterium]
MSGKASKIELPSFGPGAEKSIQKKLRALGGREISVEEDWRADEHYGVSVKGRRFVFRDPAAFYRFEEFVQTELAADRASPTH